MDLTQVEWWGRMSCARSSGRAREKEPSSGLGGSSSTCSSSTCSLEGDLGEASKISSGWIKKSIGGSGAILERHLEKVLRQRR